MDLFLPIRFRTSVQLAPSELYGDVAIILLEKLRESLEGVCSRFGYIQPGSIEIVRRSAGLFIKQHFNGHIAYDVICKAQVCNPPQGAIVKSIVRNKNAMGIFAESTIEGLDDPVLDVIVPKRAAGIVSEIDLDELEVGDEIYISVQGKRYQLNDKKISIIGKAVMKPTEVPKPDEEFADIDPLDENEDDEEDLPSEDGDEEEKEPVSDDESDTENPIRSVELEEEEAEDPEIEEELDEEVEGGEYDDEGEFSGGEYDEGI